MNYDQLSKHQVKGIKRRSFLKTVGAGAMAALACDSFLLRLGSSSVVAQSSLLSKFTEQLPIPPVIDARAGGTFSLAMSPGLHSFHSSLPATPTWGYGGASYLGPTLQTRRGVPITLNATNSLGIHPLAAFIDPNLGGVLASDATNPRVAVHLHGGNTAPTSDGHPEDTFTNGVTRTYHYGNDQEATTLWYHDHAMGITRLNVYAGLAGFYLLRDQFDTGEAIGPIGLPTGPYEIPLVIQDKMFNEDGTLAYSFGEFGSIWAPEFFGDVATVNGKVWPNLNVDRGLYRFRVLNGSNARVYNLRLSSGQTMFQIGAEGGLLNAPVALNQLTIAPGERADVLIDFSTLRVGSRVVLKNVAPTPFPDGPRARRRGGLPIKEIMQFTVGTAAGFNGAIPAFLRAAPIQLLPKPVRVRNLTLVEIADPETGVPLKALVNNLSFDTTQIEMPVVDTVEQWNIINTTGDTHPIHLHLVQFQVLGRQKFNVDAFLETYYSELEDPENAGAGPWPAPSADTFTRGSMKGPDANETGWKDTVRANPGEITRIVVPFGADAAPGVPFGQSFTGDYVFHCHILEHEDNEMMLPYRVISA
ncbi:MAG: multicopper oxidase domain-containing protein [Acidobacteriota bacterium]|nr:multicopper oxidase domain-containing protein [Acidobacteriota bacterium]